ncbi:GD17072 [Drosophila simulans]|uniref:GD17072 n=1 Tax=Drosophila simulans TaxID=7240 RepID=B4R3N3_DROSI|nr:GD17072 [Drosophila simulans]
MQQHIAQVLLILQLLDGSVCSLDCGRNGVCESGKCRCNSGWTGNLCDQLPCDSRCSEHGQCKNGTCVCSQGWNGRHCTLPGCENGCSRHGQCTLENGEYRCDCIEGWAGSDCSIALELNCKDNIDNDGDGMTDCSDSECCSHPACSEHIMCLSSNDPVEVLLRKQPPSVTASFYQRVKFLIEENSVQSYAHMDEYSENFTGAMKGKSSNLFYMKRSLHVLALEHYLPSHDENGEFHIPFPPSSEIYVFNRYGQHVATKDLTSGKTRYSFLYSKNTSFGRLSTVTDASGNKIQFLRDYSNVVSSIENTQDHKSEIQINGIGIMTKLSEKGRQEIELDYDSNTGLLNSRSSGGETYIYQYDEFGRVTGMILPSGEIVRITSQLADSQGLTVYVHASVESLFSRERIAGEANELLVLGGVRSTFLKRGQAHADAELKANNTLVIHGDNGVVVEASAVARHPLLEAALPVEAEMLAMWSHQSVTMGEGLTNSMYSVYSLVGDVRNPQQTLNREIWVNQSRVIGVEFDQFTNRETFYDARRTPILIVAYDQSGLPKSYYPTNGYPVNITYDRFNRVEGWAWGPADLKYSYDRHGLLSEITSQQDGIVSFVYNDWNLVSEIGLASQRKFVLQYDDAGGLRHVVLPSGTRGRFTTPTFIALMHCTYAPPGSRAAYRHHYSHAGALHHTILPGDGPTAYPATTPLASWRMWSRDMERVNACIPRPPDCRTPFHTLNGNWRTEGTTGMPPACSLTRGSNK